SPRSQSSLSIYYLVRFREIGTHSRDELPALAGPVHATERDARTRRRGGSRAAGVLRPAAVPALRRQSRARAAAREQPAARLAQVLEVPPGGPMAAPERVARLLADLGPDASLLIVGCGGHVTARRSALGHGMHG